MVTVAKPTTVKGWCKDCHKVTDMLVSYDGDTRTESCLACHTIASQTAPQRPECLPDMKARSQRRVISAHALRYGV